jgi:hypothetical protein
MNITRLIYFYFWCFNATFSNISAISWRPVLVMEEAGENHRPEHSTIKHDAETHIIVHAALMTKS